MRPVRRLKVTDATAEFVRSLHPQLKRKVRAALKMILSDPLSGKALKDELEGLRSFRVSRFRIIYITEKETIDVIAIGPRRTIYGETLQLIQKLK